MRNFGIQFNIGDQKPDDEAGITLLTKFGILDGKSEPILSNKALMGFSDKDSYVTFKLHIDPNQDLSAVVKKIKGFKLVKLFEKYAKIYNKKKAENIPPAQFSIKNEGNSIIFGIQGGHQLQSIKQEYISVLDPVLDKIIQLQKKAKLPDFYQYVLLESKFGASLMDLLSSSQSILETLMEGVTLKIKFAILSKLDDIILAIYKQLEENNKREQAANPTQIDSQKKAEDQDQEK